VRAVFMRELISLMRKDQSIFFLVGDMGLGLVEPFQEEFPDRFLNVGIAEQNLVGVCAGLCNVGFRPFAYTISNFLVQRSFEQIRNDLCLHDYPVTLVGTSTGFDNGTLGPTHQVIDDIGCVKIFPNMRIYSPSTVPSIKMILEDIMKNGHPAYVRIGKGSYNPEAVFSDINYFALKGPSDDVLVITHGTTLENCIKAAQISNNLSVYCMNKVKPLDVDTLRKLFGEYPKIVVVEDHFVSSGLYNSLCQTLVESRIKDTALYAIAPPDRYEDAVGDANYFAEKYGYSPERISTFVYSLLGL
jgi:transketolase